MLAAYPTVVDMMANAAFYFKLVKHLSSRSVRLAAEMLPHVVCDNLT